MSSPVAQKLYGTNKYIKIEKQSSFWQDPDFGI